MEVWTTRDKRSIRSTLPGVPTQGSSLQAQELLCGSLVTSSFVQQTYSSSVQKIRQHHIQC